MRQPPPSSRLCSRISCHPPTCGPLGTPARGIQLRTVWRLDDGCQSNTPYHLAPVTTRSIPHQRLDVRVMLQAIDCRRYSRRPHRVDPTPQQPAPPNVYHQEQVRPLVDHLHSLMHLHSTTAPYPADHPPQPHSHLIGKAKGRIRTHARSGKGATEAPFSTTPAHLRLPSHDGPSEPSGCIPTSQADRRRCPTCSSLHTRTLSSP